MILVAETCLVVVSFCLLIVTIHSMKITKGRICKLLLDIPNTELKKLISRSENFLDYYNRESAEDATEHSLTQTETHDIICNSHAHISP